MEELREWAQRENLGTKFLSGIEEMVNQGGLRKVTDDFLVDVLCIRLLPMHKKSLEAIKHKIVGKKKVRSVRWRS